MSHRMPDFEPRESEVTTMLLLLRSLERGRGEVNPDHIKRALNALLREAGMRDKRYRLLNEFQVRGSTEETIDDSPLVFGEFNYDPHERLITSPLGVNRRLPKLPGKTLQLLMIRGAEVVTPSQIAKVVWGYDESENSTAIRMNIRTVRVGIDHPGIVINGQPSQSHIFTINSSGYKLMSCDAPIYAILS